MTKPDWMNANNENETVDANAVKETKKATASTFELGLIDEVEGMRVIVGGKVKKGDTQNVMIALPGELNAKLDKQVSGAKSTAIIALVMLALQTLENESKTLKVNV